jgi:purine-binding chemotaxis protein CheW
MSWPAADESPGDWTALARAAGTIGDGEEINDLPRELLTLELGGSPYAIPVERVREIVRPRAVTRVPKMPDWVLGVVALRGEVVQVIDLRMRLDLAAPAQSRKSRIVVLHGDDDRITGILVDAVEQVLRVSEETISPAAGGDLGAVTELCEREGEFISILDLDKVLELRAD